MEEVPSDWRSSGEALRVSGAPAIVLFEGNTVGLLFPLLVDGALLVPCFNKLHAGTGSPCSSPESCRWASVS